MFKVENLIPTAPFDGKWYILFWQPRTNNLAPDQYPAQIAMWDGKIWVNDCGQPVEINQRCIAGFIRLPDRARIVEKLTAWNKSTEADRRDFFLDADDMI